MRINIIILLVGYVSCYGYQLHGFLGKLTDNYLKVNEPIIYDKVKNILRNQSISSISSWADKIKRNPKYSWTRELHYIDILECTKDYSSGIINNYCKENCIVSVIKDFTNALKYNSKYKYIKNKVVISNSELLKFLIHFIQDFNQPMHLLGFDRGGNSFKINMYDSINKKNISSNLHFIWDSLLPNYYIKHFNYTLPDITLNSQENLLENILNENIKNVACKIVPNSHYLIFQEYFVKEHFKLLFDNYHYLIIHTLKNIFDVNFN